MTEPFKNHVRVLSVDPSTNGFGFAVVEGSDQLIDWGVAKVWSKRTREAVARLAYLVDRYRPNLIVVEDVHDTRRMLKARNRIVAIARYALSRRIAVRMVSRKQVRSTFQHYGLTKFEIALAIAKMFPELAPRLPRKRKPWMSEDERMNIFDAVSFICTAMSSEERFTA